MGLPNLERGGWEPGVHWVADSPEQQKELDLRYEAERVADGVQSWSVVFDEIDEPYDREESIQSALVLIEAQESYASRPLAIVLRDALTWLNVIENDGDRYNVRHTIEREAVSLLTRTVAHEDERAEVDVELLSMAMQWSAIEIPFLA
jgi:hypothetical protein